ncbi:hypothetical protein CHS0354_025464 [Potamilus streckersoni]|uniref:Luciferin 4-monooxygenase n=1 Tax=Potamilus streckersoni TaxID=2493646 RepID=A0AAE0VHS2_9BIVA|nr:hypothetical protein CHS0354_025464 [Potamilus streckersoni]
MNESILETDMNLGELLITRMIQYGDSIALIEAETGRRYTYKDVIDRVQKLAHGLRELGIRKGDVVCTWLPNHIDYGVIYLACFYLGSPVQTMSPLETDDEIFRRFRECGTKYVFTVPSQLPQLWRIRLKLTTRLKVVVFGQADNCESYETLLQNKGEQITTGVDLDPQKTPAILLSSSGTTGLSKIVQLSHSNIVVNIQQIASIYCHNPEMRCVAFLPMYHHYGGVCVLLTGLYNGLQIVVMSEFKFQTYLQLIQDHKCEILHVVPPVANLLVKQDIVDRFDLTSVKIIHCAAAPLSQEVEKILMNKFRHRFISQTYGLSETGVVAGTSDKKHKFGSAGWIPARTEIKILDPETGKEMDPGKNGEVCVRGPQVMIGYINSQEENTNAFTSDRYFKTGDIGYIDSEGFLFIVDRIKDIIKYKGHQVSPARLEDVLLKHLDVEDAAVIGMADADSGEVPQAFVVRRLGSTVTSEVLNKHIAGRLLYMGLFVTSKAVQRSLGTSTACIQLYTVFTLKE